MDEITFDDKTYVSSKRAAAITGYAKDYVGQLCREGRVEARLVGRNWYILETSIREHRFGKEPAKPSEKDENGDWKAPTYAVESISELPVFESAPVPQREWAEQPQPEPLVDHDANVKEMQDAWQNWFTKKNEQNKGEIESTTADIVDQAPEEQVHVVKVTPSVPEYVPQQSSYSVPSFDMPRNQPIDQEIVPIQRAAPIQEEVIVPIQRPVEEVSLYQEPVSYTRPAYVPEPVYASPRADGRILRERRVKKNKKPSVALQGFFLIIAAAAIGVALIGSGQFDAFLSQNKVQYAPINFLGGENIVNNAK